MLKEKQSNTGAGSSLRLPSFRLKCIFGFGLLVVIDKELRLSDEKTYIKVKG